MPDASNIVTPLAETAEPVEALDTTPSPQPEAEVPEAASPAAEPVEGRSQESPAAEEQPKADPPKPEKTLREQLIDQLTGVEEPKSEDEDEEPTPPANKQDPAPAKPEDAKPEEIPEDLVEVTNDDIKAMKPGEGRRKINRLIKRLKDAEPYAQGYKEIVDTCAANGFAPDDYKAWVGIGIGLQRGNPQAAEHLKQIMAKAGMTVGAAGPPPELEKLLSELEEAIDVTPAAAKKLRALFKAAPAPEQPRPAAAQQQQQQQPVQPQAPVAPNPNTPDPARERGLTEMVDVGTRWKDKLGEARWKEIQPTLAAALKAKGNRPPASWGSIYEAEIEKIVAKSKPATLTSGLRPGGGQAGSSTPSFKTERERVLHRLSSG